MNTRTGEIVQGLEIMEKLTTSSWQESLNGVPDYIPVEQEDLTEKQKETKKVSKYDNKSILGKKFKESRQVRRKKERDKFKGY